MITSSPSRARLQAGAALLLAAGVLVGSIAPSSAGPTWPQNQGFTSDTPSTATSFQRHFWRGSQLSLAPAQEVEAVALDDAEATEAYCMDRFRSYEPATGTYLGYDGKEHACP